MDADQKKLTNIIRQYNLDPNWIFVKQGFRLIRKIGIDALAAHLGSPVEIQLSHVSQDGKTVVVKASAVMQNRKYSTFGEASPDNNKFPYPVNVAEKRARSRVILSALNIHGFVYGEDEIDFLLKSEKILEDRIRASQASVNATMDLIRKNKEKKKNGPKTL